MSNLDKIIILDLIINKEQLLAPDAHGSNIFNECFFSENGCHKKTLKAKALDLTKKLKFFANEFLIRDGDYVHFENYLNNGVNTNRIIISKKTDEGFVTLGGFEFVRTRKNIISSGCWGGEYDGFKQAHTKPDSFLSFRSYDDMKKAFLYNQQVRKQVRDMFFY